MPLNDVPQAAQTLAQTQNPIRQNFLTINNAFQIDHVAYVNAADINNGKHNKVTFPVQGVAPVFLAGEEGVYNLNYATTLQNELFVHKQRNQAPGTVDIPFTASILSNQTPLSNGIDGWTYLPSGILLKWGRRNANIGVQNLNAGGNLGPNFTQILNAQVSGSTAATTYTVTIGAPANMDVNSLPVNGAYFFLAIGR